MLKDLCYKNLFLEHCEVVMGLDYIFHERPVSLLAICSVAPAGNYVRFKRNEER